MDLAHRRLKTPEVRGDQGTTGYIDQSVDIVVFHVEGTAEGENEGVPAPMPRETSWTAQEVGYGHTRWVIPRLISLNITEFL